MNKLHHATRLDRIIQGQPQGPIQKGLAREVRQALWDYLAQNFPTMSSKDREAMLNQAYCRRLKRLLPADQEKLLAILAKLDAIEELQEKKAKKLLELREALGLPSRNSPAWQEMLGQLLHEKRGKQNHES